jgi:hypothetical protein
VHILTYNIDYEGDVNHILVGRLTSLLGFGKMLDRLSEFLFLVEV